MRCDSVESNVLEVLELQRLRKHLALPRRVIAQRLGTTEKTIFSWEMKGNSPSPFYLDEIRKLLKLLEKEELKIDVFEKLKVLILEEINSSWAFKSVSEHPHEQNGLLWHTVFLSSLRMTCTDGASYNDDKILAALQELCLEGKIKIWDIRARSLHDFSFSCEVGTGHFDINSNIIGKIETDRLYVTVPLTKEEQADEGQHCILNVISIVRRLGDQRRRHFESRFGIPSTGVEQQMIREDYRASLESNQRQERSVVALEKLVKKGRK